jgi:hypothetical protein
MASFHCLPTEATANSSRDDTNIVVRKAEEVRDDILSDFGYLRRGVDGDTVIFIRDGQGGLRLQIEVVLGLEFHLFEINREDNMCDYIYWGL